MSRPFIGIYRRMADFSTQENISFIRQADGLGYNGIIAHSDPSTRKEFDPAWPDEWQQIQAVLDELGWLHIVQTCPTGDDIEPWVGSALMEHNGGGDAQVCLGSGFNTDGSETSSPLWDAWETILKRTAAWYPKAAGVMFPYDEIRRFGSHPACRAWQQGGRNPGQLLCLHIRRAVALARRINPAWVVSIFDDMANPLVNAHAHYTEGGAPDIDWSGAEKAWDPQMVAQQWVTLVGPPEDKQTGTVELLANLGVKQILWYMYDQGNNDYGDGMPPGDTWAMARRVLQTRGPFICGTAYASWKENEDFSRIREFRVPADVVAMMAPFPAAGAAPPPPPPPPPPPDPLAAARAQTDRDVEAVQTRGVRTRLRADLVRERGLTGR